MIPPVSLVADKHQNKKTENKLIEEIKLLVVLKNKSKSNKKKKVVPPLLQR